MATCNLLEKTGSYPLLFSKSRIISLVLPFAHTWHVFRRPVWRASNVNWISFANCWRYTLDIPMWSSPWSPCLLYIVLRSDAIFNWCSERDREMGWRSFISKAPHLLVFIQMLSKSRNKKNTIITNVFLFLLLFFPHTVYVSSLICKNLLLIPFWSAPFFNSSICILLSLMFKFGLPFNHPVESHPLLLSSQTAITV